MTELAILLAALAYLAFDRWQTARILERQSPDLEAMVALVDRLCQRVQAPEIAVMQHDQGGEQWAPPAVGFDDDEGFALSKEQLAEMSG